MLVAGKTYTDIFYRMNFTMEKLQKMSESEYSSFIRVLFGLSTPSSVPQNLSTDPDVGNIEWIDPTLNDSQKDAIRFALASREVALIHGPPGVSFLDEELRHPLLTALDWKNTYLDRADSSDDQAQSENFSVWSI